MYPFSDDDVLLLVLDCLERLTERSDLPLDRCSVSYVREPGQYRLRAISGNSPSSSTYITPCTLKLCDTHISIVRYCRRLETHLTVLPVTELISFEKQ
jgi:hypothetical protein